MFYSINPHGPGLVRLQPFGSPPPESTPLVPGKPVVVFLHAQFSSGELWLGQLSDPRIQAAFNCVTLDMRWQYARCDNQLRCALTPRTHSGHTQETMEWDEEKHEVGAELDVMQVRRITDDVNVLRSS